MFFCHLQKSISATVKFIERICLCFERKKCVFFHHFSHTFFPKKFIFSLFPKKKHDKLPLLQAQFHFTNWYIYFPISKCVCHVYTCLWSMASEKSADLKQPPCILPLNYGGITRCKFWLDFFLHHLPLFCIILTLKFKCQNFLFTSLSLFLCTALY